MAGVRRFLTLALLIATTASSGQAPVQRARATGEPAGGVSRLSADAEQRWVPFELTGGNQIRFTATVDGRPLSAVLDTGVSVTVLSDRSAAVDRARLTAGGEATAVGGTVALRWMPTRRIAIGGSTREGGAVAVTRLPAIATASGRAVDLLVGRDLLEAHALDIDYANKRFRLIPSGRLPFTGRTAPLLVSPERRVYESAFAIGGVAIRPVVVDTGDGSALTVTAPGWSAAGLDRLRSTTAIAFGLAGVLITKLAIVPRVEVGELEAREVEVRSEAAGSFSQSIGASGRIGTGFLQNYRVLLDPRAGRMVLQPGATADRPPVRSTSGLLLGLERDRLRVLHVMANSPAAAAGWQAGASICAVNGTPVPRDYPTSPLAAWSAGAPGTEVRLTMCGGAERRLTLARFY